MSRARAESISAGVDLETGPTRPPARRPNAATPHALLALQRGAGNAAVSLAIQRLQTAGDATVGSRDPRADPRFRAVTRQISARAGMARSHPKPRVEAAKAQAAASPPTAEREPRAEIGQADIMGAARPGVFDKVGFIAAVKTAIASHAPKNLEEADDFATSGKAGAVAAQVTGTVTQAKTAASKGIAEATTATPDSSRVVTTPAVPLVAPPSAPIPAVDAAAGMPGPVPAASTDLSAGPRETDAAMADAGVTPEQLARGNEPEFDSALAAKKAGEEHSGTSPGVVRSSERATLMGARGDATGMGTAAVAGLAGAKARALGHLTAGQVSGRSSAESAREGVVSHIRALFATTKSEVTARLAALDTSVAETFGTQEKAAREAFTTEHRSEMDKYKEARYSGVSGKLAWVSDKIGSLPKEADQIFVRAKAHYEERLEGVISRIADHVGGELTWAKDRITQGRNQIQTYVSQQPKALARAARDTSSQLEASFDALEGEVDSRRDSLVEDLAAKYVEATSAVDEEITAAQEENRGLWDRAKDAIGGAITTVLKLKDMFVHVLARAAGAVGRIIADPIGFLGNFVAAVKGGITGFADRIGTHIKGALSTWLFGALGEAGIELPKAFDLKGVLSLVMSVLGLTWASIRARIAAKLPPGAIEKVESGMAIVGVLVHEGLGGLWKLVLEKVGDIKAMVMAQVKEMVSVEIIKAGIVWLVSLLNPASAFVKACKMIYDVVMFFVEKADQIKAFVDAVLDSVESIAAGGVGAVSGMIENTLAKMLPVLIGFLASALGLGGISGKIRKIIETIQKPVAKVVNWVVGKAVSFGRRAIALGSKVFGKLKSGAGKLWGKAKAKIGLKPKTPEEILAAKLKRLDKGVNAGVRAVNRFAGRPVASSILRPLLAAIRIRYRMVSLEPVANGRRWSVVGVLNPTKKKGAKGLVPKKHPKKKSDDTGPARVKVTVRKRKSLKAGMTPEEYIKKSLELGPRITQPNRMLGTGNPTDLTLEQVLSLRGRGRFKAAEKYIGQIHGMEEQQHRPVPSNPTSNFAVEGKGGRKVDGIADGGAGRKLGIEVKIYLSWRTVNGRRVKGAVPLNDVIIEQVNKDVHIRAKDPTFDPRWIFLDAPPSPQLAAYLANANIVTVIHVHARKAAK